MAKTKEELVALIQARRSISELYHDTVINKIYEGYVNDLQKSILNDDLLSLRIDKFNVMNLINRLNSGDKRNILEDIRETLPDTEYDEFAAAQDEIIETFLDNIRETETYDEDLVFPENSIQIYDFDYDDVLDQLITLFEKNGYAPKIDTNHGPKKIIVKVA